MQGGRGNLVLVSIEAHALVNDLVASLTPDIKWSLKSNNVSPLCEQLAVDLRTSVAPALTAKAVEVALVAELWVIPELRRIVSICRLAISHIA